MIRFCSLIFCKKHRSNECVLRSFPDGLGSSGRLVGFMPDYPGTFPTSWCRVMAKKPPVISRSSSPVFPRSPEARVIYICLYLPVICRGFSVHICYYLFRSSSVACIFRLAPVFFYIIPLYTRVRVFLMIFLHLPWCPLAYVLRRVCVFPYLPIISRCGFVHVLMLSYVSCEL